MEHEVIAMLKELLDELKLADDVSRDAIGATYRKVEALQEWLERVVERERGWAVLFEHGGAK